MQELAQGIFHWTAVHPNLGMDVSSYFVADSGTLIDPMTPGEGVEWFDADGRRPRRVVLTNRHHLRDSERFAEAFAIPIACHEAGLHEFRGGPDVKGFAWGDELVPGIRALEVGAICEEESALLIDSGDGFLAVADAVVNYSELGFVPDRYIGDDPPAIKSAIRAAYARLLDEPFDSLLPAHGDPIVGGAKDALRRFAGDDRPAA
jgi:glyoxylase-like metal-dependent hydrolase (beta-lactamase superfamily II)